MQKFYLSITLVMFSLITLAQTGSTLEGKVVDSKTQSPLQSVVVSIQNTAMMQITDTNGQFLFPDVPVGKYFILINSQGYINQLFEIEVIENQALDLGTIILEFDVADDLALNIIALSENDLSEDFGGADNTAGLLQASRDTYNQAAAFNWNLGWFRIRGLDNELSTTMINGITMNKIATGRPQWNNWGGLNDATRNQEFTMGSAPSDYVFGSILGTQNINTRASFYRRGSRANFAVANTNYSYRAMFTHASGMNEKGWAFTLSGSRRWAQEGNFPGTDYEGNSFLASIEKKINDQHSINITSVIAENSRGRNSFNTGEINDLMGETYNSFWGWQNGKKRNARVRSINEPFTILSHYWKFNSKTQLNTNVAYQSGRFADSRLDFQNVLNPDPTYWRNMPSYYLNYATGAPNFEAFQDQQDNFRANSQINWERMYQANRNSSDGRSVYVLFEDVNEDKQFTANTILSSQLADNISMNASVNYRSLKSHQFRELTDLLGGSYYNDFDPFQPDGFQDADLNNPGRTVGEGEKFRYNNFLRANIVDAFTQFLFKYNKVDFYLAQSYSVTQYEREGLYRNPVYADNSFGRSEVAEFKNYGFKGGFTYKITGRHLIDFNAAHLTKAPVMRNVFANARMNNVITPRIGSEEINSVDVSYIIRAPKLKSRITAFYNQINNATQVSFFYQEGGQGLGFVQEIMTGIQRINKGIEFGAEYNLSQTLSVRGAANIAEYLYGNNPHVALNSDNVITGDNQDNIQQGFSDLGTAFLKNYRAFSAPERAYSIGLEYRNPKFWWIGADMNLLTHRYLNVSALLRTESFIINPETGLGYEGATEESVRNLLKQERLEDMYILNIRGGKSWRVNSKNRNTIGLFATLNNAIGERYRTGGFEQARKATYEALSQDAQQHFDPVSGQLVQNTRTFGPRYFYSFGRNFFVNLTYNF